MTKKKSPNLLETAHRSAQPIADSASRAARGLARVEKPIANITAKVFGAAAKGAGFGLKAIGAFAVLAGSGARAGGEAIANAMEKSSQGKATVGGSVARRLGRVVGGAATLAGAATHGAGTGIGKLAGADRAVGAAVGGALAGTAEAVAGTLDHIAIHRNDIALMAERLTAQGVEYGLLANAIREGIDSVGREEKRRRILDSLTVGGVSLAAIAAGSAGVPNEVERAFQAAYPDLAAKVPFEDAVRRLNPDQLEGLIAGVKGKLFELQYVDWLNHGNLPDGLMAVLGPSATQPGWDVRIVNDAGEVVEELSLKATESSEYVREALERYPTIDVVTTDEVYQELATAGLAERVASGGFSERDLEAVVSNATETAAQGSVDFFAPSVAGLALIALFAFSDTAKSWEARSREFGSRAGQGALATATGGAVMAATHTWWLAVFGAVGSRWVWGAGAAKRERLERLGARVAANELVLTRLRRAAPPSGRLAVQPAG